MSKIELELVLKLNKLFEIKQWNKIENYEYVYESLCSLSQEIMDDEDGYKLFLDLVERYNWMSYNDYSKKIIELLKSILIDSKITISKIYTFPILKPEDKNKNKSGNSISYMIKCNKPYLKDAKKIQLLQLNTFEEINSLILKDNEYLLLVDDYIGSGETLFACIREIESINKDIIDKLIIATIAIQNDTILKLNNYKLFYNIIVKKGISENYHSPIKEQHINTMINLEKRLISGRNFSLGYEQSEGLVTMLRTPDNTFPIFWHEYKKNIKLHPPFPRD